MSAQQALCHGPLHHPPRMSDASLFWVAVGSWAFTSCFQGHSRTLPPAPSPAFPVRQCGVSSLLNGNTGYWALLQWCVESVLPAARASVAEVVRVTQETQLQDRGGTTW